MPAHTHTPMQAANLVLNVDGCIGALFLDLLGGTGLFTPAEVEDVVNIGYLNGLFVLARSIGLIGELPDGGERKARRERSARGKRLRSASQPASRQRRHRYCGPCRRYCMLGARAAADPPPHAPPPTPTLLLQGMRWTRSACASRCTATPGTTCCTPTTAPSTRDRPVPPGGSRCTAHPWDDMLCTYRPLHQADVSNRSNGCPGGHPYTNPETLRAPRQRQPRPPSCRWRQPACRVDE
jgi:hypothetical protein